MNPHGADYPIWHPFSQMKTSGDLPLVERAQGAYLYTEGGQKIFDAISSWWVNLHGHSHPHIAARVSAQLQELEHVIFAGFTHRPAIELSQRLLAHLPGEGMNWKCFFSDNGSTAVEVALKMAIQYLRREEARRPVRVIALEGSYHGDTFGAMAAAERGVFTDPWDDLFFQAFHVPPPLPGKEDACLQALREVACEGAIFIYEPLVQGAAGMQMYSAAALDAMLTAARESGCMLIADEVMTGFGRTARWFASEASAQVPDLMCLSKGLTGGALPMALTICQGYLYEAFLHDDFEKGFLHGHSFTGNPLGCAAALASLDLMESHETWEAIAMMESVYAERRQELEAHPSLFRVRQCGSILAADVAGSSGGYLHPLRDRMYHAAMERGLLLRPLGNVLYLLPPYCSREDEIHRALDGLMEVATAASK